MTEEQYGKAAISSLEEGLNAAKTIGYPVMIKAAAGGGGKGIRKCECEEEFPSLFRQVKAEVSGSAVFLMEFAQSARHLEVQLLCDEHGGAVSLWVPNFLVRFVSANLKKKEFGSKIF